MNNLGQGMTQMGALLVPQYGWPKLKSVLVKVRGGPWEEDRHLSGEEKGEVEPEEEQRIRGGGTPSGKEPWKATRKRDNKGKIIRSRLDYKREMMRQIDYFQSQTTWEIPKAPVKKIIEELTKEHTVKLGLVMPRWTATARDAIHEALESFIVEIFEDAVLVTINRRRQTTSLEDVLTANLIKWIKRPWPPDKDKKGKAKRKGKAGKKAKAHNSHHAKSTWSRS